jgi:putative transposase
VVALVATSDAELVFEGRHWRAAAGRLVEARRALSTKHEVSGCRRRAVERVAEVHRRVRNRRKDTLHTLLRALVNDYDLIVHEDLGIKNLVRRPRPRLEPDGSYASNGAGAKAGLNRSLNDAGWGELLAMIAFTAEGAGETVIAADPAIPRSAVRTVGTPLRGTGVPRLSDVWRVAMKITPT